MHEGPWARRAARRRTGLHVVLALVLLAAGAGAGYVAIVQVPKWLKGSPPPASGAPKPSLSTLDPLPGCLTPGFPDFQSLGVVAWVEGTDLHVVDLATCRQHALVEGDVAPPVRFSADGKWIAYGAGSYVPATGGKPVDVAGGAASWAWSPREDRLAVVTPGGGVSVVEPGGDGEQPRPVLPDGTGASHAMWSPDGAMLAVDSPGRVQVVDASSGRARTVFTTSGPSPTVAGWSPDSAWVLFWGKPIGTKPGSALDAVPAAGGDWRNVWDDMLPFPDFVAPCGDGVAIVGGGKRLVSQGKQILLTTPPRWRFHNVTNDYLRSWVWPSCSPDGKWVAVTAAANHVEPSFPSGVRPLWLVATDGSKRQRVDPPDLGALEAPRWSADGRTVLVVQRAENDWAAPGSPVLVQVNPRTGREVQRAALDVDLGPAPGPGGHQRWSETTDWFRPPPGG
jgi:hypothetical protein